MDDSLILEDVAETTDAVLPVEDNNDAIMTLVNILASLLNSFGGGILIGALSMATILNKLKQDIALQTSIERLAVSLPPETLEVINGLFKMLRDVGQVGIAVTDGMPNTGLPTIQQADAILYGNQGIGNKPSPKGDPPATDKS